MILLLSLLSLAAPYADAADCIGTVRNPITGFFHPCQPNFEAVKKVLNTFCDKGHERFAPLGEGESFPIAYGNVSAVVLYCKDKKAHFSHCLSVTGARVDRDSDVPYSANGDRIYCKGLDGPQPLFEYNNKTTCQLRGKLYPAGSKFSINKQDELERYDIECKREANGVAYVHHIGCNTTWGGYVKAGGFLYRKNETYPFICNLYGCHSHTETLYSGDCFDAFQGAIREKTEFTEHDNLRYRCIIPPKSATKPFSYIAERQLLGCINRRLLHPTESPLLYKNGETMKEYGAKCSKDFRAKPTGEKKICSVNGIKFELKTWLRVQVSANLGQLHYCDLAGGGHFKTLFMGCIKKDAVFLFDDNRNKTNPLDQKLMRACAIPAADWTKVPKGRLF